MKVLFIGAHPDDIELGCGGTVHKYATQWDVFCYTFCNCALGGKHADLALCHDYSMKSLGMDGRFRLGYFEPSTFPENRNEIWRTLHRLNGEFEPDLVFTHSPDDHQDHQVVYNESLRVFYSNSVVCYHIPRSEPKLDYNYYEVLSRANVDAKLRALANYHMYSFDGKWRPSVQVCMNRDNVIAQLRSNGVYIGQEFSEVFRIVKWVTK